MEANSDVTKQLVCLIRNFFKYDCFDEFFKIDHECACGKSYTTARILKQHQEKCIAAGGVKTMFPCGHGNCTMELSTAHGRRRHIKRVHLKDRDRRSVAQDAKYLNKG